VLQTLFWFSIVPLFYVYASYPVLVWVLARCMTRRPMQAVMQGYRCVFEPAAIVYDTPSPEKESSRKRRTFDGVAQLME
jgi:hypothetical protein